MNRPPFQCERRTRPRVILVPRKRRVADDNPPTREAALTALRVNPMDRSPQDVDAIISIVGKWADFNKFVRTEQERREICRRMTFEEYQKGQIVIKQGDEPDGWYLIFSGACTVFVLTDKGEEAHKQIPQQTIDTLRSAFGSEKYFLPVAVKGPTEEFGSTALTKNVLRNATIFVNKPSIILRIDPHLYRETVAWFAQIQLEKKSALLAKVEELRALRDARDVFSRLAENMEQLRFEPGTVIDDQYFAKTGESDRAFFIVGEGLMVQHRVVDFKNHKCVSKNITIAAPKGLRNVKVRDYGPGSMFPDPAMRQCVSFPFTMSVAEPAVCYQLKLKDVAPMLLNTQLIHLMDLVKSQPTDEQVMNMWMERQEAIQWKAYKKKCVKEARTMIKTQKSLMNGEWAMRKSGPPKAIKDHTPHFRVSPRRPRTAND